MVHMEVLRFLFVCLLSLESTTSFCSYDHQCGIDLKCCYGRCIYDQSSCICIQDYECEESEQCCDGRCISDSFSCPCWDDSDCVSHKLCCDRKCMKDLASCPCSDDHQCVEGKRCCGGVCLYCGWSDEAYAGAIVGPIIFVAIIIFIVSCFCCSCCPFYRYRKPGTEVNTQQHHPEFTSTETHMMTDQVQAPDYNQAPPVYPPPGPTPYPPAQVQG